MKPPETSREGKFRRLKEYLSPLYETNAKVRAAIDACWTNGSSIEMALIAALKDALR